MRNRRSFLWLTVILVAVSWVSLEIRIQANSPRLRGIGADVIVGDIGSFFNWGTSGGETALSVATVSCNIGDQELAWIENTNQHPVISQNLYRIKGGRIEQIGQAWLKHGFFALSQSLCGNCIPTNGNALGVGCSDPYGAFLNGDQPGLGPKSEVNAATGFFPYPPRRLTQAQSDLFGGRLRIANSDIDPAQNAGARYFVESQYVHPQDAAAGNNTNSTSYREVFATTDPLNLELDISSPTVRMQPAIHAWQETVSNVRLFNVDVPGDGRIVIGLRTIPFPNGGFHNVIAIENQTSDRSVGSLGLNFDSGNIGNAGFVDVDYQYEPYSDTDWVPSINFNSSEIVWSTETFAQNQNANALRWGTLYTFWCNSDRRPEEITLGLFKPGKPNSFTIDVSVLILGDANDDGVLNNLDINSFVLALTNPVQYQAMFPNVDPDVVLDMNDDGVFDNLDIAGFVDALTGS